jgi:hypothetical protein
VTVWLRKVGTICIIGKEYIEIALGNTLIRASALSRRVA